MAAAPTSRDLREGGRWSLAQTLKNGVLFVLARAALALFGRIPRAQLVRGGRWVGRLAHALLGRERRRAEANVGLVLALAGAESRALVKRTFETLGENLGDTVDLYGKPTLSRTISLEEGALELLQSARDEGRGVIFASAHLGPWERVAASLVSAGVPLVTMAREAYDPRLTEVLVRLRERHGVRAIFRGSPGAAARILRTLKQGGVLGMPMDLASRVPSIEAPFLGIAAPTPVGPARLALRTGAAVVVGTFASPGVVRMRRIETNDLRADEAGEQELSRRLNAEISERILSMPEHWPWMHDRFIGQKSERPEISG